MESDFTINFAAPLVDVPSVGSSAKFDATFDSYTAKPAVLILSDGAPIPPDRKSPVRHHSVAQASPPTN